MLLFVVIFLSSFLSDLRFLSFCLCSVVLFPFSELFVVCLMHVAVLSSFFAHYPPCLESVCFMFCSLFILCLLFSCLITFRLISACSACFSVVPLFTLCLFFVISGNRSLIIADGLICFCS